MSAYLAGLAILRAEEDEHTDDLDGMSLLVLITMASFARELPVPECYASQASIAKRAHLSVRTVGLTLARLTKLGLVEHGGKRGKTTRWLLVLLSARDADKNAGQCGELLSARDADKKTAVLLSAPDADKKAPNFVDTSARDADKRLSARDADNTSFTTDRKIKTKSLSRRRSELEPKEDPKPIRSDVDQLCMHLADKITENGSRRPTITTAWRDAARLMIDKDGRTVDQVIKAIDWCQNDEFWRANILSMPKLREKYDALRLQAQRGSGNGRYAKPALVDHNGLRLSPKRAAAMADRARYEAMDAALEAKLAGQNSSAVNGHGVQEDLGLGTVLDFRRAIS